METLREIAEANNLQIIETTPERNGYPSKLRDAIIGFDSFKEAQELADKHGLSIEVFETKDGWSLWYRSGYTKYEAFNISAETFGDNYHAFSNDIDEDEFIEIEIIPLIEDISDFTKLQELIDTKKEIYDAIENAEDDELVITLYGNLLATVKQQTMYFYHDTRHNVIGLINRD